MVRTKDSKNSFVIKKHNPSSQEHASPTQAPPTQLPFTWCGFCRTLAVCQEDQNSIWNRSLIIWHDRCLSIFCFHLRKKSTGSLKSINIVSFMNNAQRLLIMKRSVKSIMVKFCENQRLFADACHVWHNIPQISNCSIYGYADTDAQRNPWWVNEYCGDNDGTAFPLRDG